MMHVWIQGSGTGPINREKLYKSEAVMRASVVRLLRNRAHGPNAEIYVYSDFGPYSGPDQDSMIGKAAFDPDGETPRYFPIGFEQDRNDKPATLPEAGPRTRGTLSTTKRVCDRPERRPQIAQQSTVSRK